MATAAVIDTTEIQRHLNGPKGNTTDTTNTNTSTTPFDIETTLTFEAIEYWAKVAPHRTALVSSDKQWKVEHGKMAEKHSVTDPSEWTTITYGEFWDKVNRIRAALHSVGVPVPQKGAKPFRLLLLYAPPSRADVLALLMAMQAAGVCLMFGTPEAFGGLHNFCKTMIALEPDAVLCTRTVYTVFRTIAMTLPSQKTKPMWIKNSVLTKVAPKLSVKELEQYTTRTPKDAITLDSVTAIMFSSGTTGPPTPIEISQRMLGFQAAGYAGLLQKHGLTTTSEASSRQGPWTSTHIFVNFVMLDLVLGGTAVMQPMGISCPDKTVCAPTLLQIWDHFQSNVTSAPPALWRRLVKLRQESKETLALDKSLQMAFVGGAETSASFSHALATEFFSQSDDGAVYRAYGTTQVLPIAIATDTDVRQEEMSKSMCARGYGVCLGHYADGLQVQIDTESWRNKGGNAELASYKNATEDKPLEMGELCALGTAISPSMEIVSEAQVPTRIFRSGDICFVDPDTQHIYFLGRMAQAVDCSSAGLGMVPPVGVEMVAKETGMVDRCAFVGVPKSGGVVQPTLVVQFDGHDESQDVDVAAYAIRRALEKSVWAPLLQNKLSLVAYSSNKTWPVDERHSSKTNRNQLRDWAAATHHKFHKI